MLDLEKILGSLHNNNVNCIIIGGQAAIALGSAYSSFDIDFCYSHDKRNLENIVKALKPFNPTLRGVDKHLPFIFDSKTLEMGMNFTFSTDIGDIDLIGEVTGIGSYEDMLKYSEIIEIYNLPCKVLSLEGLIISKKASARQKDLIILKELEALQEIQKRKKDNS